MCLMTIIIVNASIWEAEFLSIPKQFVTIHYLC